MDRSNLRQRRTQPPRRASRTPARAPTVQVYEPERPYIPSALSNAYGASGRIVMPQKLVSRHAGTSMLKAMQSAVNREDLSDPETEQESEDQQEEEQEEADENESEEEAGQDDEEEVEEEPQDPASEEDEELEEVDELEIDDEEEDEDEDDYDGERAQSIKSQSPFVAIRNKFRNLWERTDLNDATSFVTEDKIASEARIARPKEPLARRLLRWRDQVLNKWYDYGGGSFLDILSLVAKIFTAALLLLLALIAIRPMLPNVTTVSNGIHNLGNTITSPIYSVLDTVSSMGSGSLSPTSGEFDISQLKALKDTTSSQLKHLKSRLDNIESMYNRLTSKHHKQAPLPGRKVNLFAPRSEMVIDPYLTSPTRETLKRRGIANIFARWRGYPQSIHHGPITAFTPWDDMGDCWCSPNSAGRAQIVVELGKPIIPKELIVEHVPREATSQSGSAPKNIELWAQIIDTQRREAVIRGAVDYSLRQDTDSQTERHLKSLDNTWVRIGQWKYDIHGESNVQNFEIQLPLEDFKTPIRKLAFRTTSNWGEVDFVCIYRLKLHGLVAETSGSRKFDGLGY